MEWHWLFPGIWHLCIWRFLCRIWRYARWSCTWHLRNCYCKRCYCWVSQSGYYRSRYCLPQCHRTGLFNSQCAGCFLLVGSDWRNYRRRSGHKFNNCRLGCYQPGNRQGNRKCRCFMPGYNCWYCDNCRYDQTCYHRHSCRHDCYRLYCWWCSCCCYHCFCTWVSGCVGLRQLYSWQLTYCYQQWQSLWQLSCYCHEDLSCHWCL